MNLAQVLEELIEERGIDRTVLSSIVSEGLLAAYQRKYPDLPFKASYDPESGAVKIFVTKTVVSAVRDDEVEISLRKAKAVSLAAEEGDQLDIPFDGKIGRIEILRAKQVIASRIREIEAASIYSEFKSREGEMVMGTIYKCERSGMVIKVDNTLAFLPKSLSVPEDKCLIGAPIRAILKEVLVEPRNDNQLILDRASERFLQKLFELEVPEVFERLVDIKKVVRIAGYKSKVVVVSNDKNVDPVGTCVGVGGSRIRPVLKELNGEKIDVIVWSGSLEEMVIASLKPAKINRVFVDGNMARVWLDDDQRSLAIGKMGQNIALASKLTGLDIQLASSTGSAEAKVLHDETFMQD